MTPTPKLRFVKRYLDQNYPIMILQQWWTKQTIDVGFASIEVGHGEWRDVPLEEET